MSKSLSQEESDRLYAERLAANEYFIDVDSPIQHRKGQDGGLELGARRGVRPANIRVTTIANENRAIEMREAIATTLRTSPPSAFSTSTHTESSDWSMARTLQAMEFELAGDFGAYDLKEHNASYFSRQLQTSSTFICFVQVIMCIATLIKGGVVDLHQNPMIGPSARTLIEFGAKQGALIVYRHEGWRLFTPILLHAGILHLLSNISIQLFIGGYLNLVYGTPQFLAVYICSGVFGNLLSCIAIPNSVSVGSSGAVLGMLTSWAVWIIFRWNKVPILVRKNRNIQLVVVIISIVITLSLSFSGFVDWAAHVGGAAQGLLLGLIVLSSELDNPQTKWMLRIAASITSFALFLWATIYVAVILKPDRAILDII